MKMGKKKDLGDFEGGEDGFGARKVRLDISLKADWLVFSCINHLYGLQRHQAKKRSARFKAVLNHLSTSKVYSSGYNNIYSNSCCTAVLFLCKGALF